MIVSDLVESIKTQLGYPIISLYIKDEQIQTVIKTAIRKCQSKASPTFTFKATVVSGGALDVSDHKIEAIKHIYCTSDNAVSIGDVFDAYNYNTGKYGLDLLGSHGADIIALAGANAEARKFALYDYYLDRGEKDLLYVDNYSGEVTIEYVKKEIILEELDSEWTGWVEEYSTALCKIMEGRIRAKYKLTNAPFEIESDNLISEGQSDKQDLESKLETSMGFYNILK